MYNSFQQMDWISETMLFGSILPGNTWEFGYLWLDISILYDGQRGSLGKISHEGSKVNIVTLLRGISGADQLC